MDNTIGLVAVILSLGFPLGAMYTYYCVRKLRSQERLAAMARGVEIPMEPELSQGARSRRWGILLVAGALGYMATMSIIARFAEPNAWTAAAFGIIPFALGLGFFVDWTLIRRDARVFGLISFGCWRESRSTRAAVLELGFNASCNTAPYRAATG